ncbi:MAG: alpha/beta hydrolase [Selenomonadaceae bacterium]|nr:alpha/beta hydrolase [Selenomonadaceae bacterium]
MSYLTMKDGVKIYYEDRGNGETILFCHGLNSSHLKIKNFIDEFKNNYRTVFYDQRGHESSDKSTIHMNIKTLGQDLHELIESLDLHEVTLIGHSMGAATIFSYVNQFGCDRLKRIVVVDMSPYMRNTVWQGGIAQGKWTDEDFMQDLERIFDDVGAAGWYITKNMMNPALKNTPAELDDAMIALCGKGFDPLTMASLWFSLYRTDQRPAIEKITVPLLYIMPETPLYSMVTVDYIKSHVKSDFVLEKDFPNTTHTILMETPCEVAEKVKAFIQAH